MVAFTVTRPSIGIGGVYTLASRMNNIASFLTPKSEVVWVSAQGTVGEALERMKPNGFAAVPILDDDGRYVGTLSTSDLMWYLLDAERAWQEVARSTPLLVVPRRFNDSAVHIDTALPTLVERAQSQSFVPVVDDREVFIGIVRRRTIMQHFCAVPDRASRSAIEWGPQCSRPNGSRSR